MDRVTDSIAGSAKPKPESPAGALQENVIVWILEIGLDQVMVNVLNRDLRFDAVESHRIQFKHNQRPGGILR